MTRKKLVWLAFPSIVAFSVGSMMVVGWHITAMVEPEGLRSGVRLACGFAWVVATMGVFIHKGDEIFSEGGDAKR
jgi:hypothetical protein